MSSFSNALVHCSLLLKGCRLCIWIIYTFSKYLLTLFRILEKKELDLKVILRKHSLLSSSRFCLVLWQERQSLPDLIKRTKLVCEGWLWGKCVSCLRVPLKTSLAGWVPSLIQHYYYYKQIIADPTETSCIIFVPQNKQVWCCLPVVLYPWSFCTQSFLPS